MTEAPPAPWSPFPLVELCILLALVLIVLGFVTGGPRQGLLLVCGFALASLAALELSVREHFAGFRSHSALLAGACAVGVVTPLYLVSGVGRVVLLAMGVLVFALALHLLRNAFRARAGGVGFRA